MSRTDFRTVKIRTESYDLVQKILALVAASGWKAVGSSRKTAVTIADVVDEALKDLFERAQKKR